MSLDATNQVGIEFSTNKLYMWRCIVTMAHADGLVHKEERDYLKGIFNRMREKAGLTIEDHSLLISDLSEPKDTFEMLKNINDPNYRAQVIYFARLLAYRDGELDPSEDALLKKLHAHIVEGVDMDTIRQEVRENIDKELIQQEISTDSNRPDSGVSSLIDALFVHFGIDLMD